MFGHIAKTFRVSVKCGSLDKAIGPTTPLKWTTLSALTVEKNTRQIQVIIPYICLHWR